MTDSNGEGDESNSERLYYYTQLVSVVYFIEKMTATSLKIDSNEYER